MFRRHPILSAVTFAYLGVVCWLTLGPQPVDGGDDAWLWRLLGFFSRHEVTDWITYQRVEFAANVAMFLPVGSFFLLLFGRSWWFVSMLAGVLLTAAIEFTQLFLPDRVSDVSDIIANSIGTGIGVVLVLIITAGKARRLRERAAAAGTRTTAGTGRTVPQGVGRGRR